jgi:N4-gp56 family major capsid protein
VAYAPALNLTTSTATLKHLATVYYKKVALRALRAKLFFAQAMMPDDMPNRSGKTAQWFRPVPLGALTTPATEGAVGAGIGLSTSIYSGTVAEYSDFTSTSALLQETAINDMITMASKEMSYRAALSVDTINRLAIEGGGAAIVATVGANLALNDIRKTAKLLEGLNVQGINGGDFIWITSPWNVYDVISDSTAGGFLDAVKYTSAPAALDGTMGNGLAFSGEIGKAGDCRIVATTNVGNDGTVAPGAKYYNYCVGDQAFGALALTGVGPTDVQDPDKQTFKLNVVAGGPNTADPQGMIGSYVSYRFVYAAVSLNDATAYRYSIVKADSSII